MSNKSTYHPASIIALIALQILLFSFPQLVSARVLEDGQDGTTDRWNVYDRDPAGASINSILESGGTNRYIELTGNGAANAYIIGNFTGLAGSFQETVRQELNLRFRPDGYYAFYIATMTSNGARYLYYDSQSSNQGLIWEKYIHVGLGPITTSTEWTSFKRNLNSDLLSVEPGNSLVSIDGIIVRGDMDIDDIKLENNAQTVDSTPPIITVLGESIVNISLGESYTDSGATAIDDVDGSVAVTTVNNVDTSVLGQYTVSYTATDQSNNTATAIRTVSVIQQPNSNNSHICNQPISDLDWKIYDNLPTGAHISFSGNVPNDVALLNGNGAANAYIAGGFDPSSSGWNIDVSNSTLTMDVQRSGYLAIFVIALTDHGYRYLYYDTTTTNQGLIWDKYIHYGLGASLVNGEWSTVSRDIQSDLFNFEPGNNVNSIEGIIFRGTTSVRNICFSDSSANTDNTNPVVTLNGSSAIEIELGSTYIELGATALDETDGVLPVTTIGTVNTSVEGDYTITYSATDSAGNTGSATRTVSTVNSPADTTKPVITLNGTSSIEVYVGSVYTEAGANAVDDIDGSLTVNITGFVDTTTVGTYTLTYSATDNSGNTATITRTVNVTSGNTTTTVHENGESGVSSSWWIFDDSPYGASISSTFSPEQNSNVINLQGSGASNAYMHGSNPGLPGAWGATNHTGLSWKAKANSALLIFVSVNTSNGHRYIYYNNKATSDGLIWGKYIHIGLGQLLANSQWTSFARDISSDIQNNEPGNTLISIDGIIFRGSAEVDNITTHSSINEIDIQPPDLVLNEPTYYRTLQNSMFNDPGYVVTDNEDNTVTVDISGSVNTSINGTYELLYTATDSSGNEVSKTRTVVVEPDTTAPFINLIDGHYTYVDSFSTYVDPGYTVHDNLGENTSVSRTGFVDTTIPGHYVLTYSTTDTYGNSFSTSRNVYVEPVGNTTYEDGSANLHTTWSITDDTPVGSVIEYVYDNEINSEVVHICGNGLQNSFSLYTDDIFWSNSRANQISWDGKFDGHFSIFVYLNTLYGPRYAYYTTVPGTDGLIWDNYIRKTIVAPPVNNSWKSYVRDLQNDIKDHEPNNSLESIEFLSVRGCGYLDNISLDYTNSHLNIPNVNYHVHSSMTVGETVFKPNIHHDLLNKIASFSISGPGSEYFSIDKKGNITLTAALPDRSSAESFSFTGTALDDLGVSHSFSINLENLTPVALENTSINTDIKQSGGDTSFNLSSNSVYLFKSEISLGNAGNIQFTGNNTVFMRLPSSYTTTTSTQNYYGESHIAVQSVPESFKVGDRIAMTQNGGINHDSISESRHIVDIIGNKIYIDNPFTKFYTTGAYVLKDYNFIRGLSSEQEDGYNPNINITGVHFDGNSRNNDINYSWTVNSSILLHGGMTSSILGNIFSDSPNETIVGHGMNISMNTFERLNGSAVHYSVHDNSSVHSGGSTFSYNTVSLPNMIEQGNALNGHSEGAITFSWGGGDLEVINNVFLGSNEYYGVMGLFVGAEINNDENLYVAGNIAENFRYIIKIVSPPTTPANNILITDNEFTASGYNDFTHLSQQRDIRLGCNTLSGGTVMVLSGHNTACN